MGTLTADVSRLPDFCAHKLPTSCRLTSIPQCCACADERAHAPSYSTYIDGIGFVPRGNRWQRYCWFCKEFWENRVAATNLRPSQTRIPDVPDQTEFLDKWYEFHRGYRIITNEHGSEERVAVLGEPMREVDPGCLPRTLDELRAGRDRSEADRQQHIDVPDAAVNTGPTLEATLDQLFEEATVEDSPAAPPAPAAPTRSEHDNEPPSDAMRIAGQAMRAAHSRNREYQNRRIAALRRELHRMRNGIERVISGLRELGEFVPDPTEATGRLVNLGRTLDHMEGLPDTSQRELPAPAVGAVYRDDSLMNIQQRLDEAQSQLDQAQRFRDQSSREMVTAQSALDEAIRNREEAAEVLDGADLDLADHRAQASQLRREQRTAENYFRVFGTREEIERQGTDYVSPIGGMFTRAWDRFRVAEEVRREERTLRQVLDDEQSAPEQQQQPPPLDADGDALMLEQYYSLLRRQDISQLPPQVTPHDGAAITTSAPMLPGHESARPAQPPILEHLLRNTPEPERSAIIARMRENGTAQALEEPIPSSIFDLYRRLGSSPSSARQHLYAASDNSADEEEPGPPLGLDTADSGRPEPKEDEEMTVKLDCKVCYTQTADTACLPCGHLVMCQWCSDQHSPVMQHDRTRPRVPANCPVCRKRIKQKVRIYRA